jgi:phosphatidate cytidylyltransferase
MIDTHFWSLAIGIVVFLVVATVIGQAIAWRVGRANATVSNLIQRINAWWMLIALTLPFIAIGRGTATVLFAVVSFLALREFLSLTPTRPGDRLAMFTTFFVAIPAQFGLVAMDWYGLFSILLPVYGFFLLPAASTVAQDTEDYLARCAKIQWAMMVCVYGVSHIPALLYLPIAGYDTADGALLVYFLLIAQISDVLQYVCGKLLGKRKVAPILSPAKTWEGLIGGGLLATLIGASLHQVTPFNTWQACALSLVVVVTGFFGGLILSAVKRSLGAKDWGTGIPGHGGVLDRLDSLAFSAPIFFHLTRYWFTP